MQRSGPTANGSARNEHHQPLAGEARGLAARSGGKGAGADARSWRFARAGHGPRLARENPATRPRPRRARSRAARRPLGGGRRPAAVPQGALGPGAFRFAPDTPAGELFGLWDLLPADTRVPDHTIWAHLDLVSAFAGAFALDPAGECALLTVALGPVQDFIAAARKASDLWAGSHLLSTLAWQAMKVVCERLGPDAVLFPNLRG